MNPTQRLALALSAPTITTATHAAPLHIDAMPGALTDSVEVAAVEAQKQGSDIRAMKLTDWTIPDMALASNNPDLNYFQHQVSLDNAIKERGYAFESVGIGMLDNIGLYLNKIKRLSDLEDGARVAVANDPVNQNRSLPLLQKAGLIKLRDGMGARGTLNDVIVNPKRLRFAEIEDLQLVRAFDGVSLAQGYSTHFVNAGKPDVVNAGLLYSGIDDEYFTVHFVTRNGNANDPRIVRFIKLYQDSPAVRQQMRTSYANDDRLFTLPQVERQHDKVSRP